ncbi:MAG TPA: nuclear transport factor 2 family protein [Burkholderiaceae bacterium]|jgi:ketosteroid isomerase-like protein|nr:nuclear transport factor 2 family protein [Burkholderiaceae bacterium]
MVKPNKLASTVDGTEAAFYDAIARGDVDAVMALWADDEEIVCVHPGSLRLVGHAAIRASWETILERGGIPIEPVELHATQNPMMAIRNVVEQIPLNENEAQDLHVVATNVYLKTPFGWRLAAHHASVAPGKAVVERTGKTVLH